MLATKKEYTQTAKEVYRKEANHTLIEGFKKEIKFKDQVIKEKTVLLNKHNRIQLDQPNK